MTQTLLRRTGARTLTALALTLIPLTLAANAQTPEANSPDCSQAATRAERTDCATLHAQTKTFYLQNASDQQDANEIMVAIRNVFNDSEIRIYLVASQNALVIGTYPQQMARVEALIHSLDRPKKTYRLTYTVTEIDGNKPVGTQHYSMVVTADKTTGMKVGTKIPIATSSSSDGNAASSSAQTQFQYIDIGMNFDASIAELGNGVRLKYKVEDSSLGTPVTISGVTEPIIRQNILDSSTVLPLGKPVMLGSIDLPDSTHHLDVAVVAEEVNNTTR